MRRVGRRPRALLGLSSPQGRAKTDDELLRGCWFGQPVVRRTHDLAEPLVLVLVTRHEDEGNAPERRAQLREHWSVLRLKLDQDRVGLELRSQLGGVGRI